MRLRDRAKTCLARGRDEETGIDERHRVDERPLVLGVVHHRLDALELLEDRLGLFGEDKGGELVVLFHVRVVRREELNDEAAGRALAGARTWTAAFLRALICRYWCACGHQDVGL